MSGIGLNVGLKALLTSQSALETIGHNVANANTPGYSRQRLELSAAPAVLLRGLAFGSGVRADVILRTADALIHKRLVAQLSSQGRLDARLSGLSEVEALLAEPGELGLSRLIGGFFDGLSELASDPLERSRRIGVVEAGAQLAAELRRVSGGFETLREQAAETVQAQVGEVNLLTRQIRSLNQEITRSESGGAPANDLRDQRELALRELGDLIDVTFHEDGRGSVQVYSRGQLLVGLTRSYDVSAETDPSGALALRVEGSPVPLEVQAGRIGGFLGLQQELLPELGADLDRLAHGFIFEMNKAHSTGIPPSGAFRRLTAAYAFEDRDGDGSVADEVVASEALPFAAQGGAFYVNVIDEATGSFTTHRVAIDPDRTTAADLVGALDALAHVSAGIDAQGRLQVDAQSGYRFDFSRRLNPRPDAAGTFGGGAASLTSGGGAPFALAGGDTLDFTGSLGAFTVTFAAADFADIASAEAEEVAAALNADASFAANGLVAVVVGERVAVQTAAQGSAQGFQLTGGSAAAALGWTAPVTVAGHDTAVSVELSGSYTGAQNETYRFVANGDGTVGTTPGLSVDVLDSAGNVVATLDVGAGYQPGAELAVAEGLTVRFGFGELSATHNDTFVALALSDSDTSDVLGALGLNALFTGTGAADIALRADIAADPSLLASSASGAGSDNATLLDLLRAQEVELASLDGETLAGFHGAFVGGVGFEVGSTSDAKDVEDFLVDSLVARREQASGVNVDEELVNMIQFEQAFATAAQFIQIVNQTQEELLALI